MKFDWKDAAILLSLFISMNVMSAYVHGVVNPMSWSVGDRAVVAALYALLAPLFLMMRRIP